MPGTNADVRGLGGFVWSIAEILRGGFKQSEYGKVILPFIVLRRLDCLCLALRAIGERFLEITAGKPPWQRNHAAKWESGTFEHRNFIATSLVAA